MVSKKRVYCTKIFNKVLFSFGTTLGGISALYFILDFLGNVRTVSYFRTYKLHQNFPRIYSPNCFLTIFTLRIILRILPHCCCCSLIINSCASFRPLPHQHQRSGIFNFPQEAYLSQPPLPIFHTAVK